MSSLRTLVVAETLPYPTFKGGDLRSWQNINGLTKISRVGVFAACSNGPRDRRAPMGLTFWRSSADPALTWPPLRDRKLVARGWPLDPRGHPSDMYYSDAAATELEDLMVAFRPHVVVIEGLGLHRYIEPLRRQHCRVVLDSHNIETELYQQRADLTRGNDLQARLIREVLPVRTAIIEHEAINAVDQVWVCSGHDAQVMKELHKPTVPIHVIPNGVNPDNYDMVRTSAFSCPEIVDPAKQRLIFPATFGYWPNAAAAIFLIEEVFPRLASRSSECQLLLVGNMPTSRMLKAAKTDPRIVVTGMVADIRPYLAAGSVLVVPLFEGSGTRLKILEALAANVPVVSTAKGAEGLQLENGRHLLIAETADEFVDAVQRIWADKPLKNRLAENGRDLIKQRYSWSVAERKIRRALEDLTDRWG
jgi:polysaccharide biosynthesis protein PslH